MLVSVCPSLTGWQSHQQFSTSTHSAVERLWAPTRGVNVHISWSIIKKRNKSGLYISRGNFFKSGCELAAFGVLLHTAAFIWFIFELELAQVYDFEYLHCVLRISMRWNGTEEFISVIQNMILFDLKFMNMLIMYTYPQKRGKALTCSTIYDLYQTFGRLADNAMTANK